MIERLNIQLLWQKEMENVINIIKVNIFSFFLVDSAAFKHVLIIWGCSVKTFT